jgi:hypothetical protein
MGKNFGFREDLGGSARRAPAAALVCAAAFLTAAVVGCSAGPQPVTSLRVYPKDAVQTSVIDIQAFRSSKHIELTNTSGRAIGPSILWLNAQYCRAIDGIPVGQSLKLPLIEFRDEFNDAFRGGGFFAPERPERLVLAQIETPGPDALAQGQKPEFIGLVVVGGEGE